MALNFPKKYGDKKYTNEPELHSSLPITRAKVVCNNDPKKIGRIQIRIPSYHGLPGLTDRSISDEDLPWAIPCFYGGCGQDFGSFIVPIPGSFVWVMFEDNDVEKPVYLGGIPGIGSELSKKMNNLGKEEDSPQQVWSTIPSRVDTTWDVFEGKPTGVPERHVIYKSQKGHTIMCDDTDGEESLTILDRVGQVIKFVCGVSKKKNKEKYHRELYTAEKDEQLNDEVVEESYIMVRSGEVQDAPKAPKDYKHFMQKIFHSKMTAECIDSKKDKHTTTYYDPYEYNQETQKSILNMTEDHIFFDFKDGKIHEHFCDSYWRLDAFKKCVIECTEDHMFFQYNGDGLYIDDNSLRLTFKGTTLIETDSTLTINASDLFSATAGGSDLSADNSGINGRGKEVKLEGSGSVYTEGGKTYLIGSEIHMNN